MSYLSPEETARVVELAMHWRRTTATLRPCG